MYDLYMITDTKINKTYTIALASEEYQHISETAFNINKREGHRFEIESVEQNKPLNP